MNKVKRKNSFLHTSTWSSRSHPMLALTPQVLSGPPLTNPIAPKFHPQIPSSLVPNCGLPIPFPSLLRVRLPLQLLLLLLMPTPPFLSPSAPRAQQKFTERLLRVRPVLRVEGSKACKAARAYGCKICSHRCKLWPPAVSSHVPFYPLSPPWSPIAPKTRSPMHTLTSEHNKQARRCRRSLGTVSKAIVSDRTTAILSLRPHPQNINNELPRMLTTSGTSDFRFRLGGSGHHFSPRLRRWFLPPGGGAGRESPGWACVPVTWASVKARPGQPLGLWAGHLEEGRVRLAPAREHAERAAARAI